MSSHNTYLIYNHLTLNAANFGVASLVTIANAVGKSGINKKGPFSDKSTSS